MRSTIVLPSQALVRPFAYGLLTCAITLSVQAAFLDDSIRYSANWTSFLLLFVLALGAWLYFRRLAGTFPGVTQLLQSSAAFGLAVGIAIGVFYYVSVTFIDPDYVTRTLDTAYKSWATNGYSADAVAAQVELTEMFQNPLKWSLTLAIFYFVLTGSMSFVIGYMTRENNSSSIAKVSPEHA